MATNRSRIKALEESVSQRSQPMSVFEEMNRASEDGRVAGKPIWVARYEWIERMQPFVTDQRVPPEVQEKLRADIDRLRAMADEDRERQTKLQATRGAPDPP